jgi:hypothetical protein
MQPLLRDYVIGMEPAEAVITPAAITPSAA